MPRDTLKIKVLFILQLFPFLWVAKYIKICDRDKKTSTKVFYLIAQKEISRRQL